MSSSVGGRMHINGAFFYVVRFARTSFLYPLLLAFPRSCNGGLRRWWRSARYVFSLELIHAKLTCVIHFSRATKPFRLFRQLNFECLLLPLPTITAGALSRADTGERKATSTSGECMAASAFAPSEWRRAHSGSARMAES